MRMRRRRRHRRRSTPTCSRHYDELAPFLKEQANNSIDGTVYGIPHGWGANVLQYNTEVVDPAPTSWSVGLRSRLAVRRQDRGLRLARSTSPTRRCTSWTTQPDLGIENPYALDQEQFDAAIELLKEQKPLLSEYWSDYVAYEDNFRSQQHGAGHELADHHQHAPGGRPPTPVDAVLPEEGSTAWSDNWMIHADAEHPNCAYEWINYITSPAVQATVASTFGEAPANLAGLRETADMAATARQYHTDDAAYYDQLAYWTTPTKECLDGRTDVECKDYSEWVAAWTEVKG